MNRFAYILLLIVPFFVLGMLFPNEFPQKILPFLIVFYIPLITIIRMKYIQMDWKEILKSLIPIFGIKHYIKIFTKK